jgi:glycosyltransferase involved in cell wall biosynthesis
MLGAAGIHLRYQPRPQRNFDWQCVRRIRELCVETHCKVFHCDNMHTSPLLGAFLAGTSVRIWCKRSMNAHYEELRPPRLRERVAVSTRLSYRLATRVVAVSTAVRDELLELGAPSSRVVVMGNPRPAVRTSVPRNVARAIYSYSDHDVVIVAVGHAVPVKGWDLMLEAFIAIASTTDRARLLMVGSTSDDHERSLFEQLKARAVQAGVERLVRFTGRLSEVGTPLAAADIFALPSRSEGCCNALLEAIDAGLPCVATEVGNAAEVIDPGVNGFIVARNDLEVFARCLIRLTLDDELRASFAARAVLSKSIPTRVEHAQGLADLYKGLLGLKYSSAATAVVQSPTHEIQID